MTDELRERVATVLDADPDEFADRVEAEVRELKAAVRDGTFDNSQAIVGLEWELYGVDDDSFTLARIPRRLLELIGFEKELGLHNAEMGTNPQPLNRHGIAAQATELRANLKAGRMETRMNGLRLVSDGLWTIPPAGETTAEYLGDSADVDGIRLGSNMSESPRYHAMSNTTGYAPAMRTEVPNAAVEADTVLPASLTTSIQPHYQVSHAPYIPEYHRYALRVAAPLLALGVNSPFLPPDCYDDVDADTVVDEAWMENRVFAFEGTLNPVDGADKVAFPPDVDTVEEAIDRIAMDPPVVPGAVEDAGRFDDRFKHFRHKHGTYWRWVRPVFGGATRSSANARIEFRPIPAQPTVDDVIAFLATFAGLMESLPTVVHPVGELEWSVAKENFYAAAREGVEADLEWITANGETTTDADRIYEELFEYAVEGLTRRDLPEREAREYVRPLRERAEAGTTPARWKVEQVRRRLDGGADLTEAVHDAQRAYVDRQSETQLSGNFAGWLD